ncbi:thimet oligopeptidase [Ranunculus cassubicifolius]
MAKEKKERRILAFTGAAALAAVALNLLITAINTRRNNKKRKDLKGSNVRINLSAKEIIKLADEVISRSKKVYDAVASVPLDKVTYANVILPLAELEAEQLPLVQSCVFPKMVSVSEDVRKASAEAERRIEAHAFICSKREDVYRAIKTFAAGGEWTNPEAKRYAQCLVRDFERNGLNLTLSKREELQRLESKINDLSMRYIQNLDEDDSFLLFNEKELDGMPTIFIKSLDKVQNSLMKVTLKRHHVSPLLEYCKVGITRKRVAVAYGQRCGKANLSIVENLVQLRHKLARLLGYPNYADYVVQCRMAKNSAKVFEFLEHISARLTDSATKELNALKDLKKKEEGDSPFGIEDLLYYLKRVEEQKFYVDFGDIDQYFPADLVLSGILKIFQDLFGIRFDEIAEAETWHCDVRLFSAWDLSSNELLGYLYLDMYSREGKYGHTCVVPLQNASVASSGVHQIPVALLVCQLRKEGEDNTCLLRFSDVVKLFHELGHVAHLICNRASYAKFSGLRVDPDFREIPSLVLENWCYDSSSLKLISGFHQDMTKPITDEMCASLKKRRDSFSALKVKQEILQCLFDQIMHSNENIDPVELLKHLHPKVMLGLPMLEGINPASCMPRFAIGSEASCYTHIWSEVFAADIFASKFQDGLSNHFVGLQFRNKVLGPGGAKEPVELLSDFLGREPSVEAYIERKIRNSL